MSKPNINELGLPAELTLHEKALRKAQYEIDQLRAENARLREELRVERAGRSLLAPNQGDRILCGEPPMPVPIQSQMADALRATYDSTRHAETPHFKNIPLPPHHSAIGTPHGVQG